MKKFYFLPAALLSTLLFSCGGSENNAVQQEQTVVQEKKKDAIREKALLMFAVLPDKAENPKNPLSEAKITLGKTLYSLTLASPKMVKIVVILAIIFPLLVWIIFLLRLAIWEKMVQETLQQYLMQLYLEVYTFKVFYYAKHFAWTQR